MNTMIKSIGKILLALPIMIVSSCSDLTETNINPNTVLAKDIDPLFVMTKVIGESVSQNTRMLYGTGVSRSVLLEAQQYLQRDFLESSVTNTFLWFSQSWGPDYSTPLANTSYLIQRAPGQKDENFMMGVGLIFKSYWFGYLTSAWGDIPYSEAMRAEDGIFKPVFDEQKNVFKGILEDLDKANELLTGVSTVTGTAKTADILYGGDVLKWRKFANSLRLRFLMRLSEKTADMKAIGVDVAAGIGEIASNSTKYPLITSSADNAAYTYPGLTAADSWTGGTFNWSTRSEFYRRKPSATIINTLKTAGDPRLTVWIRPVDVQIVIKDMGADDKIQLDVDGKVRRYLKTYAPGVDTSLYVGLPAAQPNPDAYNKNSATVVSTVKALKSTIYSEGAANPHVSYLADMYQKNSDPLIQCVFISAAEVNFILAEATVRGWATGSALDSYKKGISESLNQFKIAAGDKKVYNTKTHALDNFDLQAFLTKAEQQYNAAANKLEPILTQSWIAGWMGSDAWFGWRRTGYPDLGKNIVAGGNGQKIPLRYGYGDEEKNYNIDNVNAAISRLDTKKDDQWAKMWLLQGTGKPY
ncbi:hypothetical protein DYBT9275_02323 [Dyadobacter sp. CECT 9275]|uniref:SusD/RagB family nutrient-binding outer membrane lipoprotein n=1 Tax=Dyadobacter helix TaxID=2822344 RepID=A0A916JCD5_9BACT|nr:SusD/RagB family nutrient-binding outer membrane lipoprotein [Dyadobacter sp. CECT 9275]CAG4999844.1 hypothetical protein DYBT9275_02323 [Dyadobacter sp. CECT 9275]